MSNIGSRFIAASALVSLTCATVGLTGCQYRSKKDTYYLISTNLKLPYWKTVNAGFTKAANEYGVTAQLEGPQDFDTQVELDSFNRAVASHPAGIIVSVADAVNMRTAINSAVAAGVPVITVDSDAPLSNRLYFIGTNNLEAGHLGARHLLEHLHGKANVVFYSINGQPNIEERLKGYNDILAEHPQIRIADVFDTKGDAGTAFDKTEEYMARTGDDKIDAFICLESSCGKSIAEVLKRKNATDRILIAMDVDADILSAIKDGSIDATISQKPFTMGYVGLKALDEIHHNLPKSFRISYAVDPFSPYPSFIDTGTSLIDKSNVDLYMGAEAAASGK